MQEEDDPGEHGNRDQRERRVEEDERDPEDEEQEDLGRNDDRCAEEGDCGCADAASEGIDGFGGRPSLNVDERTAEEVARKTHRYVGLPVREEPEDAPGHEGRKGGLADKHGDCRDGDDDRLLGEGESAHPDEIQQAVDLGREPRYPDGCHGDGGEQPDERDAEQIEETERDLNGCGCHQEPALASRQKGDRPAD